MPSGKYKRTSTHLKNMRIAQLGKKMSIVSRKKMSNWHKRKKLTVKHKTNISKSHKGEKSHFWKGGITKINKIVRESVDYNIWRNAVYKRDNFTCQKSGIKGGKLVAHHIKNFSQYPKLRFVVNNGVTLSKNEHEKFHKKYGKRNNTRKQLQEFLIKI